MLALGRSFVGSNVPWRSLPKVYDPKDLMRAAREGDMQAYNSLILGYMRLAGAIAARFARKWPKKGQDLLSIAYLTLVECAPKLIHLEPDHVPKYLHVSIRNRINDYIASDFVIKPPHKSEWYVKQVREGGYEKIFEVVGTVLYVEPDTEDRAGTPVADTSSFDGCYLDDLINHRVFSERERAILRWLVEGLTMEEIGEKLGVSKQRISVMVKAMAERVKHVAKGDW